MLKGLSGLVTRLTSLLPALLLSFGVAAFAQSGPTGSLSGEAHDPTGASVSGAKVTAVHAETKLSRSATADAEGRWNLAVLPVGNYKVTIEANGFKKAVADIAVEAAVPRVLDIKLEVGEVSVEVNITDAAPLVTPTTATTFRQLSGQELVQVPTSTRSFTHLLSAEAGVSADLPPVLTNGTGNISPSVNGTRTTSTSLTFNGVDATNLTSNEGVAHRQHLARAGNLQEVKLQTSLYDASTGRSGGGNFQLITKSGGNKFHGSALLLRPEREVQRQRFLLQQGRHRQAAGAAQRRRIHHRRPSRQRQDLLLRRISAHQRRDRLRADCAEHHSAAAKRSARSAAPRTAANIVAAFRQLNPALHA